MILGVFSNLRDSVITSRISFCSDEKVVEEDQQSCQENSGVSSPGQRDAEILGGSVSCPAWVVSCTVMLVR